MARTTIAAITGPSPYSVLGKTLPETAADTANGNQTPTADDGDYLLIVRNTGASAHTFTMNTFAVPKYGTRPTLSQSLAAGEKRAFRFTKVGWGNPANAYNAEFNGNHAELVFSLLDLRGTDLTGP